MIGIRRPVYTIIIVFGLFSWMPVIAYGDLVAGKVNPVPASKTFKIKDSQGQFVKSSVRTDAQGNFEVTLRPGVYTAISDDESTATIRSSNRPLLGQVINFR